MFELTSEGPYAPPKRSRATRMFPARSKASARGFLLAKLRSETASRQVIFESDLERKCLLVILAQKGVVDVWDQPPQVEFRGPDGRIKYHTFDYLVTRDDGKKLAIAVKPEALVEKYNFGEHLALLRAQLPLRFADDAVLVTENSFSPAEVRNAELLHMFNGTADPDADALISMQLEGLSGDTRIKEVVNSSGLDGRAFRAVFRSIFAGVVSTDLTCPITELSVLSPMEAG